MVSVPHIAPRESGQENDFSKAGAIPEHAPENPDSPLTEDPASGVFVLPGGFVSDDGVVHRRGVMRPLTGFEEEWLCDLPSSTFAASVVTGLLTCCLVRLGSISPVPRSVVGGLLISDREYLIMKMREMTLGDRVDSVIRCANEDCGTPMHVSFSLADFVIEQEPVAQRFFKKHVSSGGSYDSDCEVEFRLPTGDDQESLAQVFTRDENAAGRQLLARCVRRIGEQTEIGDAEISSLPDDARRELSMEMERLAPSLVGEFESACPECGFICSSSLDFSTFFLAEMKSSPLLLERDIHLLAWNYHWTEREVLSLTRKKRQRYVEMVNEEIDRRIGIV